MYEEAEVGVENVQITLKSFIDFYVGKVYEVPDPEGNLVLSVVKEITRVEIKQGKLTLDAVVQPLQIL